MQRRTFLTHAGQGAMLALAGCTTTRAGYTAATGFSDWPQLQSMPGQEMRVIKAFRFVDPRGVTWTVPKGVKTDGASIPRFLWTIAGSPWSSDYKDAAIVHDVYCDSMARSWEDTHRVFYDGMISRGMAESTATKYYWAVYKFGPRWNATHRWTSFLKLDHAPRKLSTGSAKYAASPPPPPPPPPTVPDGVVTASGQLADPEAIAAYQLDAYSAAAAQIDAMGLGPQDIPALNPAPPLG